MTLSELLADLYRRNSYPSSPAAAVTTHYTALLNETQREVFGSPGLEHLLQGTTTLASVASTPQYGLPPSVARLLTVYEATNRRRLWPLDLETYRTIEPDPTAQTGTPTHYVDLGLSWVSRQPSDASEIFVDSTSAGDTNTAYIEGYRTNGYFTSLSVTMTGTTAVTLSATITDIIEITKFYLSAAAVGTVTLHEDASGGTELARIAVGQTMTRRRKIALWPTPASAITYSLDFERDITPLVNANDEPSLPVRFHSLLGIGARKKDYEKKDADQRYVVAKREYDQMLSDLKYFVASQNDGRPVMGRKKIERPSSLGAWYGSGT